MFGTLRIFKDKLTKEEQEEYQAYYCGLCRNLRNRFGKNSTLVLQYDCVFLALLRNGLYENEETFSSSFCGHKMRKMTGVSVQGLDYAAEMNLLLAYQNFKDRIHDGKKRNLSLTAAMKAADSLAEIYKTEREKYPEQAKSIETYVEALQRYEDEQIALGDDSAFSLDIAAEMTGNMLADLFDEKHDEFSEYLRGLGASLGKFIYLTDAYEDLPKDLQSGDYNPLKRIKDEPDYQERVESMLTFLAGEAARYFEMLPIFRHRELLRNILYSGIWINYETAKKKQVGEKRNGKN